MTGELSLVGQWNEVMLEAIRTDGASPTPTTYHLHLTTAAVYDAWAAYDGQAYGYYSDIVRPVEEHTDANKAMAVSYAFHEMLVTFFPEQEALFDSFMAELGFDPAAQGDGATDPITVAKLAVQGVWNARTEDGSNRENGYADTTGYAPINDPQEGADGAPGGAEFDPNHWQPLRVPTGTLLDENGHPTYDDNDPTTFTDQIALTPHWGGVKGFGLESVGQVRPDAPPQKGDLSEYTDALGNVTTNDQAYKDQFTAVMQASADLTVEQKVIAEYWADGPRSESPPGHWNQLAQDISLREGHGIDDDAKMFFALNAALLDAGIATWEAKYFYDFVRPQSAIRDMFYDQEIQSWGGADQGTQTILGQDWQPYQESTFVTPPFPEYTSGHSSFSMAAAHTISAYVGSDTFFDGSTRSNYDLDSVEGIDLLGQYVTDELVFEDFTGEPVVLQWETLTEAAEEAGVSRIFGGIHIQDGDLNGRIIGKDVAALGQTKWEALFTRGGDDDIVGTTGADLILGGTGDDTVAAGDGDDTVTGGAGNDELSGGAGADAFKDVIDDLLGDMITDFEAGIDSIVFDNSEIARTDIALRDGSAILGIDTDGSGTVEGDEELTLQRSFAGGDFMAVAQNGDTHVTFEEFLPQLAEKQAIDPGAVNGMINANFFVGNGTRDFQITQRDIAGADFDNALGVYEVDNAGNLINAQVLISSTGTPSAAAVLQDVTAGNQLGFFLVQDGADWATALASGDTISFVNEAGTAAQISDGAAVVLAVNGSATDETVFHSIDAALNTDGLQHALSGVDAGGTSISLGFEDMLDGGDMDFQDVVIRIESADTFIM
ncbi:MAG: DUF6851 domain-containing protein [Sulfitobacter sp.]